MGETRWPIDRLVGEVVSLGDRGLPRREYFRELSARLRHGIDSDATCWHTLDPHTRVMTSDAPDELIERGVFTAESAPEAGRVMVTSEYLRDDVNTFAGLAARRAPVGILSDVTRGRPERSAALPRPARARGHPVRAPGGLRQPGPGLGRGPHRATRDLGRFPP